MTATVLENEQELERWCALVQVGNAGVWGQFQIVGELNSETGDWVVCQTGRGLELGQVKLIEPWQDSHEAVGPVLRRASDTDMLTWQRIQRALPEGINACNLWLEEQGFYQQILEVDMPLDGQRLYFQFLGDVDAALDAVIEELVNRMDEVTRIREFTQAVAVGCGPSCGSDGSGCSSRTGSASGAETTQRAGCSSCQLSGGCGIRTPTPKRSSPAQ